MGTITRANLRTQILQELGDYVIGTATGGSLSSVVDTARIEPDDRWINCYIEILTAGGTAPEGEIRLVTDSVQATGTAMVAPPFTAAPASGDTYLLHVLQATRVDWAIDQALKEAFPGWFKDVVDKTTLDSVAGTYSYALPAAVAVLLDVWVETMDTTRMTVPPWQVREQPGAQKLVFDAVPAYPHDIGLHYAARPTLGTASTATLDVGASSQSAADEEHLATFITARALELVHARDYRRSGDERNWNMARYWREERLGARQNSMVWPAGTVHAPADSEAQAALKTVEEQGS